MLPTRDDLHVQNHHWPVDYQGRFGRSAVLLDSANSSPFSGQRSKNHLIWSLVEIKLLHHFFHPSVFTITLVIQNDSRSMLEGGVGTPQHKVESG